MEFPITELLDYEGLSERLCTMAEFHTPALPKKRRDNVAGGARGNLKRISPVFIAALVALH